MHNCQILLKLKTKQYANINKQTHSLKYSIPPVWLSRGIFVTITRDFQII